jgi:diguanylate cyclase (GGDEF)-like protein/PAS domain S-box-containing protein
VWDTTTHVLDGDRLRASEERYATALAGANDGIWDWDLAEQKLFYSARWKSLLGYAEDEIGDGPEEWFDRIEPEDVQAVRLEVDLHLRGLTPHFQAEYRMRAKDGEPLWVLTRGICQRDSDGTAIRMAGSQTDITDRKRTEEVLLHGALYDPLTSLANRALLLDRLSFMTSRVRRNPELRFAVLYVDLDNFKGVNDAFGHVGGDEVLTAIGARVRSVVPSEHTVARMGGDEYAVVVETPGDLADAARLAERVLDQVRIPVKLKERSVRITASVGIAFSDSRYRHADEVLRDADIAMHRAKSRGGDAYDAYDERLRDEATETLETEAGLRQALDAGQLELFYQPIVAVGTGALVGAEALLRWRHPDDGLLLPARFMNVAEDSGLIVPIGEWVLAEACRTLRSWSDSGHHDLGMSVNLSLKQFKAGIVGRVKSALSETGVDASRLTLEITESVAMDDPEHSSQIIQELHELGVSIAIDDFGTGYTSLGYFKQFRFEEIKVDRSFVSDIDVDAESAALVAAIIGLTHSFRARAVAEGVETTEQLSYLRLLNCDYAQGYLFSRPVPLPEFEELLTQGRGAWLGLRF